MGSSRGRNGHGELAAQPSRIYYVPSYGCCYYVVTPSVINASTYVISQAPAPFCKLPHLYASKNFVDLIRLLIPEISCSDYLYVLCRRYFVGCWLRTSLSGTPFPIPTMIYIQYLLPNVLCPSQDEMSVNYMYPIHAKAIA